MKDFIKNFKMRFSYVLISGIIGIIFQGIGFFTWNNASDVTGSLLRTSKLNKYMNGYLFSSYFVIVSTLFLIAMAVGYFFLARKEQKWTKISACVLGGSQTLNLISTIVFMIVLAANRKYMFATTVMKSGLKDVYVFEQVLLAIRNISMALTAGAFVSMSLSLRKLNSKRAFSKYGTWVSVVTNGAFVLSMIVVGFASIKLIPYQFVSRLFDGSVSQSFSALTEFKSTFLNPNGFTMSQLNVALNIVDQISTSIDPSKFKTLNASAIIGIIAIISYLVSMLGNLVSIAGSTIDSFDLDRDDDKLAI